MASVKKRIDWSRPSAMAKSTCYLTCAGMLVPACIYFFEFISPLIYFWFIFKIYTLGIEIKHTVKILPTVRKEKNREKKTRNNMIMIVNFFLLLQVLVRDYGTWCRTILIYWFVFSIFFFFHFSLHQEQIALTPCGFLFL